MAGELNEEQLVFTMGYRNKDHSDMLTTFAYVYTALGKEAVKCNKFSGGSFKIIGAKIVDINLEKLKLEVTIKDCNKSEPLIETIHL